MKVMFLTPGTGNFYCGNCLRDGSLAKGLHELEVDVSIMPLYLPIVSEECKKFETWPLVMGGVNVFLQEHLSLFRHSPVWLDRLFDSKWVLHNAAKKAGMTKASELGPLTISMLQGLEGRQSKEVKKMIDQISTREHPDVVIISNSLLMGLTKPLKNIGIKKVVVTLQGGTGFVASLNETDQKKCVRLMNKASASVDHFIAVSKFYKNKVVNQFGFDSAKISVVHNGVDLNLMAKNDKQDSRTIRIGFLSRICDVKGAIELAEAFNELKNSLPDFDIKLVFAGTKTTADEEYFKKLKNFVLSKNLSNSVEYRLNIDDKEKKTFLSEIDILSVPVKYDDSFGLYVLEAWAAGVPVVLPSIGAFVEILKKSHGGLLYEAGNQNALTNTLRTLVQDYKKARKMGAYGQEAVQNYFNYQRMASEVKELLEA